MADFLAVQVVNACRRSVRIGVYNVYTYLALATETRRSLSTRGVTTATADRAMQEPITSKMVGDRNSVTIEHL